MFDTEKLATTEFYHKRFGNFATLIIVPCGLLVLGLILFLFFARHETTVTGVANLTPNRQVQTIQSVSGNRIRDNRLTEGKRVKKGQLLLAYTDETGQATSAALAQRIAKIEKQAQDLASLIMAVQRDRDQYTGSQTYGCQDQLTDYLAQRRTLQLESDQIDVGETDTTGSPAAKTQREQKKTLTQKLIALQAQTLQNLRSQQVKLQQTIVSLQIKQNANAKNAQQLKIHAMQSGILHVNREFLHVARVPAGSVLGQVLPDLHRQRTSFMRMTVPAANVAGLRSGQSVHIRMVRNLPTPLVLTGRIKQIDTASTVTKQGNVFGVTIVVHLTKLQRHSLRYGMSGQSAVVTGRQTYLQYLWTQMTTK